MFFFENIGLSSSRKNQITGCFTKKRKPTHWCRPSVDPPVVISPWPAQPDPPLILPLDGVHISPVSAMHTDLGVAEDPLSSIFLEWNGNWMRLWLGAFMKKKWWCPAWKAFEIRRNACCAPIWLCTMGKSGGCSCAPCAMQIPNCY